MFNDMKVGTRLAIAFGVVLVLLVAVVAIGVSRMANINAQLRSIADENVVQMQLAHEIRAASYSVSSTIRNLIILTDEDKLQADYAKLQDAFEKARKDRE